MILSWTWFKILNCQHLQRWIKNKRVFHRFLQMSPEINPYKINKVMKKTEDFNKVWKKLILKRKLLVSDVVPDQWFTIDSIKQLNMYKKRITK